jgi:hypothetical protein
MYGSRNAAARRIDERDSRGTVRLVSQMTLKPGQTVADAAVTVGRMPRSRNAASVHVGAQGPCASSAEAANVGTLAIPCDNLQATRPKPLGSGDVTVTAGLTNTATLTPVHPFQVIDYGINDPSGVLLVTSIKAGTDDLIEGGSLRTATWNAQNTMCKIQSPFTIYPWSGLKFTFSNTTSGDIVVNVWATGIISRC